MLEKNGFSKENYQKKEKEIGLDSLRQVEKFIFLKIIDSLWVDHLENLQTLQDAVRLRAYGQQDPLVEFKNEAHKMFQSLLTMFESEAAKVLDGIKPSAQIKPPTASISTPGEKIGRNEPCPCGSGKKYKRCHGK